MDVPEALKTLRRERGWTQRELAAELRKTEITVRRWELGLRSPSPEICEKLAALATGDAASCFRTKAGVASKPAPTAGPGAVIEAARPERAAVPPAWKPDKGAAIPRPAFEAILALLERNSAGRKWRDADERTPLGGGLPGQAHPTEPSASPRKGVDTAGEARHSLEPSGEPKREKGSIRTALTIQIAPEHERYFRSLERILASHEKGAIETIKASLDALERLAKLADKRLAEEERAARQARRHA